MAPSDEPESFWRENWLWFAVPILVFGGIVAWLVFDASPGATPFTYDHGN